MKISVSFFLAGFIFCGMSSCSSTTTETADTVATTETLTTDLAKTEPGMTNPVTGTGNMAPSGNLSEDPTNFVLLAGSLDLLQTRSSNQALAKATNAEVRNFAQAVVADHSHVTRQLRGLATKKELRYPTDLLPKHQLLMNQLQEEKSKDFDKTYMEIQEASHKEFEELFEDASKRHTDPDMKAFASQNLPVLRTQLVNTKKIKDLVD